MGTAYLELMQDPDILQVQLHGFAAAPGDPDIAACCRRTFEVLWTVHQGADRHVATTRSGPSSPWG